MSWSRRWFRDDDGWHSATYNRGDQPTHSDCLGWYLAHFEDWWRDTDNRPLESRDPPFEENLCQDCRVARILGP